jgi:exodeoxyribonuclease VII small subunit
MAEQKFEDALGKLEQIVDDLESGRLGLDEAIKKYEEGIKLANFCDGKLNETKKKIELLVKDASGRVSAKGFEELETETEATEKTARPKQTGKRRRPRGEELLF